MRALFFFRRFEVARLEPIYAICTNSHLFFFKTLFILTIDIIP